MKEGKEKEKQQFIVSKLEKKYNHVKTQGWKSMWPAHSCFFNV